MNGGKLLSGVYRKGGSDNGTSDWFTSNVMRFVDPNSIDTMEATVTLLDASTTGAGVTSFPRASLFGTFYWDGTGTGSSSDLTGHVFADLSLALSTITGFPVVLNIVFKCLDLTCENINIIADNVLADIDFFEPHTLRLEYDGTSFLFSRDGGCPVTITPVDAIRNPPTVAFKHLRTRFSLPTDAAVSASILALFDDVSVNSARILAETATADAQ